MKPHLEKPTIIISAGGTGGHIFPALAVAAELSREYTIIWVGANYGLENQLIPKHGYPLKTVNFAGIRNKGLIRKLALPFIMLRAVGQSLKIIRSCRPQLVAGFGGYAAFPIALSAWLMRVPIVIHEQNSVAGLSNKVLSYLATKVLTAFPKVLAGPKTSLVGNPVRKEILDITSCSTQKEQPGKLRVLVVGGSLGAKALNEQIPLALGLVTDKIASIVHQVGRGQSEIVRSMYTNCDGCAPVQVLDFIDNMAQAYAAADLVICRAGASTVAEIAASGRAAIFIPYPYAVDDHQTHNARYLADQGAALIMPQAELTPEDLARLISQLTVAECQAIGMKARALAIGDSTILICKQIKQLLS